jgi:hypothetical protein
VRDDVERRLLDRMEGAIAASAPFNRSASVMAALVIGFDFAVREGFRRILGDPPAGTEHDRLADLLSGSTEPVSPVLGRVLAAAWRAALVAVGEGSDPQQARAALLALEFRLSSRPPSAGTLHP